MTPDDFMHAVVDAYHRARDIRPIDSTLGDKLQRGRSRSISSDAEEILATYLLKSCADIDQIRIDQPTRLDKRPGEKRARVFYPDVMILRSGVVEHLIDVKTDIGWARDKLPEKAKRHFEDVQRAHGSTCTIKNRGDSKTFLVSKALTYDIVLISANNITEEKLDVGLQEARAISPRVAVFVLSTEAHPNSYDFPREEALRRIKINYEEFDRLKARVSAPKRSMLSSLLGLQA